MPLVECTALLACFRYPNQTWIAENDDAVGVILLRKKVLLKVDATTVLQPSFHYTQGVGTVANLTVVPQEKKQVALTHLL